MMKAQVLLYDQSASFEAPTEIPLNANHIATLEWSSSPINYMINRYMISLDASGTHWLLWIKADDTEDESEDQLVAYGEKTDEDVKQTSASLLKEYWIAYFTEYENPVQHYKLIQKGILDENDLEAIVSEIDFI
jgi:hypothetical protein